MMNKITNLVTGKNKENPDWIMEQAKGKLQNCIVMGDSIDEDGGFGLYITTNQTRESILWKLRIIEDMLMSGEL